MDVVSILAGGWSFTGLDPAKLPGHRIGVNEAALLGNTDEIVTMDRLWTESRWQQLSELARPAYVRMSALKRIAEPWPDWLRPFTCNHKTVNFAQEDGYLNGTNSGGCAFNRAYQLRPKKLYLFGFDMCRSPANEPYWYPKYTWAPRGATKNMKYVEWSGQFESMAKECRKAGIEVINASMVSRIKAFPQVDPRHVLEGQ